MDEATSALDSRTEMEMNDAMRTFYPLKTMIGIVHKELSLKYCQRVFVVDRHA